MPTPPDEGMTPSRDDPVLTPPRGAANVVRIRTILSSIMTLLGAFVLIRLLLRGGDPLTGTRLLDIAFGVFFIARGALFFWSVRRYRRG